MAYTDYTSIVRESITGATSADLRWAFAKRIVSALKADAVSPWVTRGSSRNGTSGIVFSATPDGVDHWAGRTQTEAASVGNPVWHVLQNVATGHQVCLLLGTTSGPASSITVVFSLNKLEAAGAWRGGGTSTALRPTDTVSTPAAGRELNTNAGSLTPQSLSNEYFHLFNRKDGRGFYTMLVRDVTPDASSDGYYGGYFPFNSPFSGDANPYLAFSGNNAFTNAVLPFNTNSNGNFVGRLQDGTLQEHRSIRIEDETDTGWLARLNPWTAGYQVHAIAFQSVTTKDVRYWMPDFFICSGTTPVSSTLATRDSKKSYRYSSQVAQQWGLVGPWDGSTTAGTDVPISKFPAFGTDGEAGASTDNKRINRGLETV